MKKILLILPILFLTSACGHNLDVTVDPLKRATLDIPAPPPLEMDPVQWTIKVENDEPQYCVDTDNFVNLANNLEKVQNRLDLQKSTIEKQKEYYEVNQ